MLGTGLHVDLETQRTLEPLGVELLELIDPSDLPFAEGQILPVPLRDAPVATPNESHEPRQGREAIRRLFSGPQRPNGVPRRPHIRMIHLTQEIGQRLPRRTRRLGPIANSKQNLVLCRLFARVLQGLHHRLLRRPRFRRKGRNGRAGTSDSPTELEGVLKLEKIVHPGGTVTHRPLEHARHHTGKEQLGAFQLLPNLLFVDEGNAIVRTAYRPKLHAVKPPELRVVKGPIEVTRNGVGEPDWNHGWTSVTEKAVYDFIYDPRMGCRDRRKLEGKALDRPERLPDLFRKRGVGFFARGDRPVSPHNHTSFMSTDAPSPSEPDAMQSQPVTYEDVRAAADRLDGIAHRTPVMTSRTVDARSEAEVFFKCENFQRTGAFKIRGAYNAIRQLPPEAKERGVITYSSGNHAQAVAVAGQHLNVSATIVMPENAPQVKLDATRGYGAEVVPYDPETAVREELGQRIAEERGLTLIPPYDHPDIVAGQGTVGDELFEEVGALDVLLVPCGGGGLLSGCALAAQHHVPNCTVIGVEPDAGDDATRSFYSGELQTVQNPDTVADGARTPYLGDVTFPLVLEHVDEMVTVSDAALVQAMHLLWERMKIVVEPTGALGAAALLDGTVPGRNQRIGVVISGGNVDLGRAADLFETYALN